MSICNISEHTGRDRESEIEIGRKRGKESEIKTAIEIERKEEREHSVHQPNWILFHNKFNKYIQNPNLIDIISFLRTMKLSSVEVFL